MGLFTLILTAFALSMDAFAVSITKGMTLKKIDTKIAFKIAFFFGLFQGVMPLIGWAAGISFESSIKSIDHWIALILLTIIGGKMLYEAFSGDGDDAEDASSTTITNKDLFILAIATSIDALAVGISFAFLSVDIVPAVLSIGIITFLTCFIGVLVGKKVGGLFGNYAEIIGGVILILIGLNIFNEHTGFISNLFK